MAQATILAEDTHHTMALFCGLSHNTSRGYTVGLFCGPSSQARKQTQTVLSKKITYLELVGPCDLSSHGLFCFNQKVVDLPQRPEVILLWNTNDNDVSQNNNKTAYARTSEGLKCLLSRNKQVDGISETSGKPSTHWTQ